MTDTGDTVTQEAREAAADLYLRLDDDWSAEVIREAMAIRDGNRDFAPAVQFLVEFRSQVRQASTQELVEALEKAERAIAEYYRYWTGGETRGSYDGKPERQGLWEAQRRARTTLSRYRGEG